MDVDFKEREEMKLAFELCKIEVVELLEMYYRLCMCNMA
jgi:hypothetical protein